MQCLYLWLPVQRVYIYVWFHTAEYYNVLNGTIQYLNTH